MNVLDLNIVDTNSPRTLAILDASTYSGTPSGPTMDVYIPGFSAKTVTFVPKKMNVYNSNLLGLSNVTSAASLSELPDGIYKVVYEVSSETVTKTFMRVEKLRCKYANALLSIDSCCDNYDVLIKKLLNVEFLMYASIAAANICNTHTAIDLYNCASEQLDLIISKM